MLQAKDDIMSGGQGDAGADTLRARDRTRDTVNGGAGVDSATADAGAKSS